MGERNWAMEVYWNERSPGEDGKKKKEREILRKIEVYQPFSYGEQKGFIAALYLGKRGVIADLCVEVSPEKVRAYQEKWQDCAGAGKDLTDEEIEQFEREAPFRFPFSPALEIDKETLVFSGSQSDAWNPLQQEGMAPAQEAVSAPYGVDWIVPERFVECYGCDKKAGWFLERMTFRWKKTAPENPKEFAFRFRAQKVSCGNTHFCTATGCKEHKVKLIHPVSKKSYELTIHSCEPGEIERESAAFQIQKEMVWPTHYAELNYTILPEPKKDSFSVLDCAKSDQPVPKKEMEKKGACAISVIGRADGPTSLFIAGASPRGAQKQTALSALHFHPVSKVEWRAVFRVKEQEDFQVYWKYEKGNR